MNFISTVTDKMAEKATDFVCDKFKDVLTNKELKDKFKGASQKYFDQIFENCGLSGEFDFEAVETYLLNNFDNKIIAIFHEIKNIGSKGRDSIREDVLRGAVARGNGNEKAIRKYCNAIIDFVGTCLYDKISDSDKQLASEITVVTNEYYKHLVNEMGDLKDIELKILSEIRYFGSFAEQIDNLGLPKVITTNKFSFANPHISFYGRCDEQKEIDKFMSDNRPLLFWAITGRGGVGKSKFALYLCQKYELANWKAVWLNKDKIENINRIAHNGGYNKPLLFICDYAGEYIESIKTFLLNISCRTQNKIRLLLLERSGYNQSSNNDYFTYLNTWYNRLLSGHNSDEIKEIEYCIDSLNLDNYVLDDEDIFSILDDFSSKRLSEASKKDIVAFVKTSLNSVFEKDNSSCSEERCLFVLFAADAFLNGNDYKCWDTKSLIDQYIKRFRRNLEAQYDKNLCESAYIILAIATAIGVISLENIDYDDIFTYYIDLIKDKLNYNIDINNVKLFLSILCEKDTLDLNIYPMLPDLVGEFFFVNIFNTISLKHRQKLYSIFCSKKYQKCFCRFLKRCLDDWHSIEMCQDIIKGFLEFVVYNNYDSILEECVKNSFFSALAFYYALTEKYLLWLKKVLLRNKVKQFYIEYANALFNVSVYMHNSKDVLKFANQIKDEVLSVYRTYKTTEIYVYLLIYSIIKTSNVDEITAIKKIIKDEVLDTYGNADFVRFYFFVLGATARRTDDVNLIMVISKIIKDDLLNVYNTNDIAECYSIVLEHAAEKVSDADQVMSIAKIIKDELLGVYSTDKIAVHYASTLEHAAEKISDADQIMSIAKIIKDELLDVYSTDIIAAHYASTLEHAAEKISDADQIMSIAKIIKDELLDVYSTDIIAAHYASTLEYAAEKISDADQIMSIAKIIKDELLDVYSTDKIVKNYVSILTCAAQKASNVDKILTIAQIINDEALSVYKTDEFAESYAFALLVAATKTSNANEIVTFAEIIKSEVLSVYRTNMIALCYTMTLGYFTLFVSNIDELLKIASKIKEILIIYNTKRIAEFYIIVLERIYKDHPKYKYLLEEVEVMRSEYDILIEKE